MRTTRRELNLYSFYDHTGMERHLEKMVAKGWMLEKLGGLWRYRRCEPKKLRFCVAYYPDASAYDPEEPSEGEQTFWDYCAQAGWVKVANRAQMQVFCNEDENAVPIETEAAVQVETLHRAAKKEYLGGQWGLIILSVIQILLNIGRLRDELADTLANVGTLGLFLDYALLILMCSLELIGYYRWRRRAKRAAEELGRFTPTHSYPFYQAAVLFVVTMFGLIWFVYLDNWRLCLVALLLPAAISGTMYAVRAVLRRRGADASTTKAASIGACLIVSVICFGLLIRGASNDWFNKVPENAEPYEYTYSTLGGKETSTEYAYHDPLPLYVEDLTETDYDHYSCERQVSASPLVRKQTFSQRMRWGERGVDAPELYYRVYDVKLGPLFEPCLQNLLKPDSSLSFYDYQYAEIDAAAWGADRAWQEYDAMDGQEYNYWVLVYGHRIVTLSASDIDMDGADMALVGERLGK